MVRFLFRTLSRPFFFSPRLAQALAGGSLSIPGKDLSGGVPWLDLGALAIPLPPLDSYVFSIRSQNPFF